MSQKITSDPGVCVSAGWYLAIGSYTDGFSNKEHRAVALVTVSGEAPFLQFQFNCKQGCDRLHLVERIEPSSELEQRIIYANYAPAS